MCYKWLLLTKRSTKITRRPSETVYFLQLVIRGFYRVTSHFHSFLLHGEAFRHIFYNIFFQFLTNFQPKWVGLWNMAKPTQSYMKIGPILSEITVMIKVIMSRT